jgi:hypothetical protein
MHEIDVTHLNGCQKFLQCCAGLTGAPGFRTLSKPGLYNLVPEVLVIWMYVREDLRF